MNLEVSDDDLYWELRTEAHEQTTYRLRQRLKAARARAAEPARRSLTQAEIAAIRDDLAARCRPPQAAEDID